MNTLLPAAITPPEQVPLDQGQHDLVFYALVVAGLALFASFVHSWNSKGEVSARYRPAVLASTCITGVAALSYLVLSVKFDSGYQLADGLWQPTPEAMFSISPRYMDWTVTVPLLMVELLAVSTLAGRKLGAVRASTIAASIGMIVTGYLGTQVFDQGASQFWLWLWWAISMAFFVYLYVALVPVITATVKALPADAGRAYGLAGGLLLTTFLVYPVVYLVPLFFDGGWWTAGIQVAFAVADITAKVGFGALIHKVAKLRTAHDVARGADTHPEPVWVDHELRSAGLQPAVAGGAGVDVPEPRRRAGEPVGRDEAPLRR
jgi:bacteriorhodopsin